MLFYFCIVLSFLKKLFGLKPKENQLPEMKKYLIVGLGNIGVKYENTRHNIGFKVLDFMAKKADLIFETKKLGDLTELKIKGRKYILLKPNTYMNLSGKAVLYWLKKENIPLEHILIITDDLNIPFGTLRLKTKGSNGGHNGLKDIQDKLQTTSYARLRIGISDTFSKGRQIDYVLGKWNDHENEVLEKYIEVFSKAVESFVLSGAARTMNTFNGPIKIESPSE